MSGFGPVLIHEMGMMMRGESEAVADPHNTWSAEGVAVNDACPTDLANERSRAHRLVDVVCRVWGPTLTYFHLCGAHGGLFCKVRNVM